jgi:DNA-binding SARP family transcriptional activator
MLKLCALGGATLTRDDTPVAGAASQHRRTALLTVIACAGPRGISRDSLLALFWPDSPEDRARHVLSQWLFLMRRDLGVDDLITGSHTLRLNAEQIAADVTAFDEAIANHAWSAAATVYRGPLLDGFLLSNAPEFQRWLDGARERRHRAAMRAIEQLARATESLDPEQATSWWQRLAALDPHSGPTAAKVIRLLADRGDGLAALAFARRHEEALRTALDLAPSAEVITLVEGLRRALQARRTRDAPALNGGSADPYLEFIRDRLASRFVVDHQSARNSIVTSFAARDTSNLTPMTLKVFVPDLLARTDVARLRELLETVARVQHPNIEATRAVAIVDGVLYFAIDGAHVSTLHDRLDTESPLPVPSAVGIARQLAAGLAAAHACGVAHGNVTPRRVVLHDENVQLTELGVLPAVAASVIRTTHDSGYPSGTQAYMSPEQLLGDDATKLPSDVYGLGCVLYEMLTGRPPHAGATARVDLRARLREPAASMRHLRGVEATQLDALVDAMLAHAPAARPTAADVCRELAALR